VKETVKICCCLVHEKFRRRSSRNVHRLAGSTLHAPRQCWIGQSLFTAAQTKQRSTNYFFVDLWV